MNTLAGEPTVLKLVDLKKSFGSVRAVDGLSLEARQGEILGFLGPNGAGKTTTLRMMTGLLRPDGGRVEILGVPLTPTTAKGLQAVGYCPQDIVVWDMLTCLEQLEFMGRSYGVDRRAARRRGEELLDVFGLAEKRHKLGRTLSGGMLRRLNIALALVHEPEILFLDEPQAGLDPQSRVRVRDYVRSLRDRMTVILTTHDMEEAEKLSDRVCIIDQGRLLVLDTVKNIKSGLGEGDLIEIEIVGDPDRDLVPFVPSLGESGARFTVRGRTLSLVSADATGVLPDVLNAVKARGLKLVNLRLRPKTLEDVFIKLTGRGLRE
ncbi:MAG: ABC transporter ATP-binding protein [Acidobacteria bacterium]|nr:ABC transporter ATP-binding protein [Acidobacteriota bacterium]